MCVVSSELGHLRFIGLDDPQAGLLTRSQPFRQFGEASVSDWTGDDQVGILGI